MQLGSYLKEVLYGFDRDPPDTEFQEGYLEAFWEIRRIAEQEGWILPLISTAPKPRNLRLNKEQK